MYIEDYIKLITLNLDSIMHYYLTELIEMGT